MEKVLGLLNLHSDRDLGLLTAKRPIASTSFLGRYAFMDFPLSNFTNSDIDEIGILVRDNLRSLIRHLGSGHDFTDNTKIGSITMLYDEPYAHNLGYNHDVNNLLENKWMIDRSKATTVVIAPASVIAKIDFRPYIEEHHRRGSKITWLYTPSTKAKDSFIDRDLLTLDDHGYIKDFEINRGDINDALISLSTLIIDRQELENLLNFASSTSAFFNLRDALKLFSKHVPILALPFYGYAAYFDSLSSYLTQSLDLLNTDVCSKLFSPDWPIFTKTYDTPPTRYGPNADVKHSFVANGAHIDGTVINSIIGRDVVIKRGAVVANTIICSGTTIGEDAHLNWVVSDKETQIIFSKELTGTPDNPFFIKRDDIV